MNFETPGGRMSFMSRPLLFFLWIHAMYACNHREVRKPGFSGSGI